MARGRGVGRGEGGCGQRSGAVKSGEHHDNRSSCRVHPHQPSIIMITMTDVS